jgi:hypothetical protein
MSSIPRFHVEKELPDWKTFSQKLRGFAGVDDRQAFALQAMKDGRGLPAEMNPTINELRGIEGFSEAMKGWIAWADPTGSDEPTSSGKTHYVIENPQSTAWHKVRAAYLGKRILLGDVNKADAVFNYEQLKIGDTHAPFFDEEPQVFLIEHNWAAAFEGASDFDEGEFPLPYQHSAFEFVLSGRRVIVLTLERQCTVVSEIGVGWWLASVIRTFDDLGETALYPALYKLIRALCIAMDAEVVASTVVRAPHRLNRQRERQGKLPINDYHTVNLARRSRVERLPSTGEPDAKWHPRLHFVRGHWRHYDNHKTWIRWHLRGDPDLGFIDKHYRA